MAMKPGREVVVAGVGLHPFGRFPDKSPQDLAKTAVLEALDDAGVGYKNIQAAYFGHVYFEGMSVGEGVLNQLGLTGIPVINVENACSSGSTGLWLAFWAVASGQFDIVLAFGAEKVPRGPVAVTSGDSPERLIGADFMMASYAQMMRRYMAQHGAPVEAFAQVSVKAHKNAAANPYAHYKKVFTMEDVLNSRMIADPLTLYQCCPTSEGGSAAVICAREVADKYVKDTSRLVTIAGAALRTTKYDDAEEGDEVAPAGRDAYAMAGLAPEDVSVVQVHDAGTSGELLGIESMGLAEKGQAWRLELDGETEIGGKLPVNTDGGLQGMGHPFGATGARDLSQAVKELWAMPAGSRAIVSICADGGQGTVALLERP